MTAKRLSDGLVPTVWRWLRSCLTKTSPKHTTHFTRQQIPSKAEQASDVYVHVHVHASWVSKYGSNYHPIPEQDRGVHANTLTSINSVRT